MRVIRDRVSKLTIVVTIRDKPWFNDWCVLAHSAQQREYEVWSRSRTQTDWGEYRMARGRAQLVYEDAERAFTERSKSLLTNSPNPRK